MKKHPAWPDFTPEPFAFGNGMHGYVSRGGTTDVIQITCMVAAGNRYQLHPLAAFMAVAMLPEGTPELTSAQISDKLDGCGANFSVENTDDCSFITMMTLRSHLAELLPMFASILYEPVFPEQQYDLLLEQKRQKHLLGMQHNQVLSRKLLLEAMFGTKHGYGRGIETQDFDNLTLQKVINHYHAAYHPSRMTLFVSGKVESEDMTLIARYLDRMVAASGEYGLSDAGPDSFAPAAQHIIHVVRSKDVQTSVRFGMPVCPPAHPDRPALLVMKTILGGYFGSRLMQNLRADKGITYGADALIFSQQQAAYMQLLSEVKGEATSLALSEVHNEADRMRQSLAKRNELSLAKRYAAGQMLRNMDGPFNREALCIQTALHGLPADWYVRLYEGMLDVTAEMVRDAAQKYLRDEDMYEVAVGGFQG